jgi:spore maturation protein SpmA
MRALIRVVVLNATLSTLDIPVSVILVTMAHAVKHMVNVSTYHVFESVPHCNQHDIYRYIQC